MTQSGWAKMALAAALSLAAAEVRAGTIEVSPVTITMEPGQMATTLTVVNHGSTRTAIQMRGFSWSQGPTTDTLSPTSDIVLSPPMFQLNPEETQTVRLLLRHPAQATEKSYRLLLDELPAGGDPGSVQFALRLSLPLFAAPASKGTPDLTWRVVPGAAGPELRVANHGTRHDRVTDIAVALPGGSTVKPGGLQNPYVLAGSERALPMPAGRVGFAGARLAVSGTDDLGRINAQAPVQAAP